MSLRCLTGPHASRTPLSLLTLYSTSFPCALLPLAALLSLEQTDTPASEPLQMLFLLPELHLSDNYRANSLISSKSSLKSHHFEA